MVLAISCHPRDTRDPNAVAESVRIFGIISNACDDAPDICADTTSDGYPTPTYICRLPNKAFDAHVRSLLTGLKYDHNIEFKDVALNRSQLNDLFKKVQARLPELESHGVLNNPSDPPTIDGCRSQVIVYAPEPWPADLPDLLHQMFGPHVVPAPPMKRL